MPRAPKKAVLANAIWTHMPPDIAGPTSEVQQVLDGVALLHHITRPNEFPTYQEVMRPLLWLCVAKLWARHRSLRWLPHSIQQVHNTSTAHRWQSRNRGHIHRCEVGMSKDVFLSNVANKQNFIDMLSHYLQLTGCLTEHVEEDADLLIAQTAVQLAATKSTVLVADHTDLVILLCYLRRSTWLRLVHAVFDTGTTKKNRIWDIKVTQSELGADICNNILFIHAILGCDTTSRLYCLGKWLSLKRFTSRALFRDKAERFCKKDATVDDVIDAGEAALVCLHSGNEGENLDGLWYAK